MGTVNCLRCNFRHADNGNCTAVGGFCTAVTAAHCPLLQRFLDIGLTPDEIVKMGMAYEDSKRYSGRLELKLNAAVKRMPRWIPVTERLPEDRSDVLVVAYWHEKWGVYMGWCAPERAAWSVHIGIGDRNDITVTYWMPLPKPPKED